jgi:hypothetical protein
VVAPVALTPPNRFKRTDKRSGFWGQANLIAAVERFRDTTQPRFARQLLYQFS